MKRKSHWEVCQVPKNSCNSDTSEYEYIDENGYSWDRGEYVYNWDDSEYRREKEEEERRRWDDNENDW